MIEMLTVEVDAGTRPVEHDVGLDGRQARLGLEPHAALLLVEPDLAHEVPRDAGAPRHLPPRSFFFPPAGNQHRSSFRRRITPRRLTHQKRLLQKCFPKDTG